MLQKVQKIHFTDSSHLYEKNKKQDERKQGWVFCTIQGTRLEC